MLHHLILEYSLDIALFQLKQAEDAHDNAKDDMGRIKPGLEVLACQVRVDFIDWKQNALDMRLVEQGDFHDRRLVPCPVP